MSHLPYFDYPTFGTRTKRDLNASQAVRVNNAIEISGQGGWDPVTEEFPVALADELDQAFSNVQLALQTAGGKGWEGVYKVRMYISLRDQDGWPEYAESLIRGLKKWCPNHGPIVTVVEVKGLFRDMRVEIEATEHLG
ncbi:putative L-PSP endoribonuclease family protein [Bimuria novae-zelandiae CBS 107.79]|uniref:Putative L-PSP endoribonuclease family protein n=1 Tax=Bimuria novae-zelandiae CBS 107.79 TaxID=1447943 RepID=A0A6A5UL17_9PLEO|nr:putative L-PSP endoribonuclease family protein [Bimuria novae-zelandiae CBS 107.79]